MQKLKERYTYTPKNITHVRSNCDHVLNIPEGRESVHGSKTSFNNPDASLTPREQGIRSHIKNTAPRLIKGFQRYDNVLWKNVECFIFGRRKTGYFDIRKLNGDKIHSSAKVGDLRLLESFGTLLTT